MTAALCCVLFAAAPPMPKGSSSKLLKIARESPGDLEVSGLLTGVPPSSSRFVSYSDLLTLPQVTIKVTGDENFADMHTPTVKVSGVRLSVLAKALGAAPEASTITALCSDKYLGIFSAPYIITHDPVLVLKINGLSYAEWARRTHNEDPGPYLVASKNFVPSYRVLAYKEQPQVPDNLVSLAFDTPQSIDAAIAPSARFPTGSPQQSGFAIARVTCLKCHNARQVGGTKADRPWSTLSRDAVNDPATFARRVNNPKSVDPKATMPANPSFDKATLAALTAYFQSMPTE